MKVKQYLYITNPVEFTSNPKLGIYGLGKTTRMNEAEYLRHWVLVGEVEFEVDIDSSKVIEKAAESIDKVIQETRAEFEVKMNALEDRKQKLLAITHGGEE